MQNVLQPLVLITPPLVLPVHQISFSCASIRLPLAASDIISGKKIVDCITRVLFFSHNKKSRVRWSRMLFKQALENLESILGFEGYIDSVTTTQLCPWNEKAAIESRQINNEQINSSHGQCKQMNMAIYQ